MVVLLRLISQHANRAVKRKAIRADHFSICVTGPVTALPACQAESRAARSSRLGGQRADSGTHVMTAGSNICFGAFCTSAFVMWRTDIHVTSPTFLNCTAW